MNIRDKVAELAMQHSGEKVNMDETLLTIITRYQLFEPCRYLGEDDEWVNVAMVSFENDNVAQAMSIKKSEIVMFAIYNPEEVEITLPQSDPEVFYQ